MNKNITVYVRNGGSHYHTTKNCPMLEGGDYERLEYYPIELFKVNKRIYHPHYCDRLVGQGKKPTE